MDGDLICAALDKKSAEGADFKTLLELAVEKVHDSESSFHWTGIYELYPDRMLRLGPFIGAATDHVFIGVGEGVCGTAVKEERNMNIPDVHSVDNYLACSQETTSELVVLIRKGNYIWGQIDIDSHHKNAFTQHIEDQVQKVADWLADLYENREKTRAA